MGIYEKLIKVQNELKAPKSQYNSFGKYNYRSCEDILEALKPVCDKHKAVTIISDSVETVGNRQYIKATVTFADTETCESIKSTGFAREEESKKGMDGSQVTGASSSYARKYALNGMFCIDDTKDSDATNTHGKDKEIKGLSEAQIKRLYAIASKAGFDAKVVAGHVKKKFNKQISELTKEEYDIMITGYEKVGA